MSRSVVSIFDELVALKPPAVATVVLETACVLGGSVAGLLAARVLADHARRVIVIERDDVLSEGTPRLGTPHDSQVHTLLPAGQHWVERWLPGFTAEVQGLGGVVSGPDTTCTAFDGDRQANSGAAAHTLLLASRPLLESCLRARVQALPNVSVMHGRATGLMYRGDAVKAVRYIDGGAEKVTQADFVVDAMGRSSRLSDWLTQDGFDTPRHERLHSPINYATALFRRGTKAADLEVAAALGIFSPEHAIDGVSVAAMTAIEGELWQVLLMGYGQDRPGRSMAQFRDVCTRLPGVFEETVRGAVVRDVVTYHQEESRRRGFVGLNRFPARLVSVGDAVASFNPIYGQGMSSAALHASCLSSYLTAGADLNIAADDFFHLQEIVVDAAWAISAGGDSARLDAVLGRAVPDEVGQQRLALQKVIAASLVDAGVARAFNEVSYMLRHPAILADPALMARAVAATRGSGDMVRQD
jgi:2-polyprenyl-6-methoxyphenol hydroxylase-like FAD-dependent oxidoreductase